MSIPKIGLWAMDVGSYKCGCYVEEIDRDTSIVTIVENGKEVERETISTKGDEGWRRPFDWAERARAKYIPRYHDEIRQARG